MRLVFSNILYPLQTKSTFLLTVKNFGGVLRSLSDLKILIGKFFYYFLKSCQKTQQKSSFLTVLIVKALISW